MAVIEAGKSNRVNVQKVADAVNRPGVMKPKDFVRELRDAGMTILGNGGRGCLQILNPDSGMKGHVNPNGEGFNRPYRLKVVRTLGVALRKDADKEQH